jgi:Bacterial Ig domain
MRSARLLIVLVASCTIVLQLHAVTASASTVKLSASGVFDFNYGDAVKAHGGPATGYKPESKLFYTGDGASETVRWWGVFGTSGPSPTSGIYLWELVNHVWQPRALLPGADVWDKADVVFDGATAYVALRDNGNSGVTGNPRESLLYRIPYLGGGVWGSIPAPTVITNRDPETLTVAKDSGGRLWSTFEDGLKIKVGYTAPGGTSFTYMDIPTTNVTSDDISDVTAFGGNRIGVAWSDQATKKDYFAWRNDTDPIGSWTIEVAYGGGVGGCPTAHGTNCADDHLNIKIVGDEVYIAVKTSLNDQSGTSADPLITLLRRTSGGTWASFPVSPVSQNASRPIVELDPSDDKIYVFANRAGEVDVWESSFSSPGFNSGAFSRWVKSTAGTANDPTGTKQQVTGATGVVVLTSVNGRDEYWHNEFLASGLSGTPPTANSASTSTQEDTSVSIQLSGSDAETCELAFSIVTGPSHGSLGPISNAPCVAGNPSPNTDQATITYSPAANYAGSDSFTYRVNDGLLDSNVATVTIDVNAVNDPPVAAGRSVSTTEDTPVPVQLSGSDPDNCDLTFSVVTGPSNGSLGSISDAPCVAGSPNTDKATVTYSPAASFTGTDSFTYTVDDGTTTSSAATVTIAVEAPGSGISFRSASSATNGTGLTLDVQAPAGIVSGDVLVAVIDVRGTPAITAPAGWTLVRLDEIATTMRQGLYVRVATGSEPSSYTWGFSKSQTAVAGILGYSGVDPTSPVDASSGLANATAVTTITAPSITTSANGDEIIGFFGITGTRTMTPPGGTTERFDIAASGVTYPVSASGADFEQLAAGATNDMVAVASGTGKNIGQQIALRPAAP